MAGNSWSVDIKDFQSLKDVHIDIIPGLNIIVGKSNSGKSAIFRGIDASLFNLGDDSMIRSGKRYYGISISNGSHKMVFMRDGKGKNEKSAYQFDGGTVQKKVGRTQLPEVARMFNVRDVKMNNGSKMKINFWYQNDRPFLMDKTPGQLYEFLSLSSSDRYSRVLKTMQADCKVLDAEISNITTEIDTIKSVNNRKQDFLDKNVGYDKVYYDIVTASQNKKKMDYVDSLLSDIMDLEKKSRDVFVQSTLLSSKIDSIPMDTFISMYKGLARDFSEFNSVDKSVEDVEKCRKAADLVTEKLSDVSDRSSEVDGIYNGTKDIVEKISGFADLVKDVGFILSSLEVTEGKKVDVERKISYLDSIDLPDLASVQNTISYIEDSKRLFMDTENMIDAVSVLISSLDSYDLRLKDLQGKIELNHKELEDLKDMVGFCPFCGTVFDKYTGHTHDTMEVSL